MLRALLILLLLFATPALAAPTCEDRSGNTVRCENPAAMPLGWKAPQVDRNFAPTDWGAVEQALIMFVLLLALIALLPDFDGARWGEEQFDEDDKE